MQLVHTVDTVAPTIVEEVPAGQETQLDDADAPGVVRYSPAGHPMQVDVPELD